VRVYWSSPIEVTANRIYVGQYFSNSTKDNLVNLFNKNGFALIRKGTFFAQDIYVDGFKRGDINVLIDGERFHHACPNRMDPPLMRINPLEMETVDLVKTSSIIQSGFAGAVNFHRTVPQEELLIKAAFSGTSGSTKSADASSLIEGENHRLTLRYSYGKPYQTAEGSSFKDLYGYKDNYAYSLIEGSFQGKSKQIHYGGGYSYTENVSFPYLLMDEIYNKALNAFLSLDNHKLYFNYTDHLMDNSLRESAMTMETKAYSFTSGLVGDFYEVYYRFWNSNNYIKTPMVLIENKLMPKVASISTKVQKTFEIEDISILPKLGVRYNSLADDSNNKLYRLLYPNADINRWFLSLGILASYFNAFGTEWYMGNSLELNTLAPELEFLYVAVKKPMGKPTWLGNPDLNQPFRSTYRLNLNYLNKAQIELSGSYVWNYVYLTNMKVNDLSYLTYDNINALLFGINLSSDWKYFDLRFSYTWAENTSTKKPLGEILPVRIEGTLKLPDFHGLFALLRAAYHGKQDRIDIYLNETSSASWYSFDLAFKYQIEPVQILFEIDNLTNELYTQHLSYMRNPFASGAQVFEPGRLVRLSVRYNEVF
jgi:iron complex outermembrane receptor protein